MDNKLNNKNRNVFVKSAEYIAYVYHELFDILTVELKQYVLDPEIIPTNFTIRYEKIVDTKVVIKLTLINGSLNYKVENAYKNNNSFILNYAFQISSDEILAKGVVKMKVKVPTKKSISTIITKLHTIQKENPSFFEKSGKQIIDYLSQGQISAIGFMSDDLPTDILKNTNSTKRR
ncbi:MAG: hypothetical protein ACXVNN_04780 [Bacteroidia bacterium]